jgi:O-antigen/teichoic acid export membrane protein
VAQQSGSTSSAKAVNGAAWVVIEMVTVQLISFAVFAFVAHYVTPNEFGLVSIALSITFTLKYLMLDNAAMAVGREPHARDEDYSCAFWITVAFSGLSWLALYLSSDVIEMVWRAPGLGRFVRLTAIALLAVGLSRTHEMWFVRNFGYRSLALRGTAGAIIGAIGAVVVAINGGGAFALVVQQLLTSITATILLWSVCPWKPSLRFAAIPARKIMSFMIRSLPNSLTFLAMQSGDTLLIGLLFGPAQAGVYAVAKRVRLSLHMIVTAPFGSIAVPLLAEAQDRPDIFEVRFLSLLKWVSLASAPVFFGVAAVSPDALALLFGKSWNAAAGPLFWLAIGGYGAALLAFIEAVLIVKNRPLMPFLTSLLYSFISAVLLVALAGRASADPALAVTLPYLAVVPFALGLFAAATTINAGAIILAIAPGCLAALIMMAMLLSPLMGLLPDHIRFGVMCLAGTCLYGAALAILTPQSLRDVGHAVASRISRSSA